MFVVDVLDAWCLIYYERDLLKQRLVSSEVDWVDWILSIGLNEDEDEDEATNPCIPHAAVMDFGFCHYLSEQTVWPSSAVPSDGQIDSVNFDTICLAVKRRSEPRDCGRVDDGQTNSVN